MLLAAGVRGDGHGERLVRTAREHPLLSDVDNVTLSCREGLAEFYERSGFERHDGTFEQWGEEEPAVMMYWHPEMDDERGLANWQASSAIETPGIGQPPRRGEEPRTARSFK